MDAPGERNFANQILGESSIVRECGIEFITGGIVVPNQRLRSSEIAGVLCGANAAGTSAKSEQL